MLITETGSVRVDLVGGTLDIEPIPLVLKNAYTLNVATTLQAKVSIEECDFNGIKIHSEDYNSHFDLEDSLFYKEKLEEEDFGPMFFVALILNYFEVTKGYKITLSSGAPAGSGLGGSSAMGVTLFKALAKLKNMSFDHHHSVRIVKGIESVILNQGMPGYQDYYPALTGGVLALHSKPGEIVYEQLYNDNLKTFLEENITLVYSGISRKSGINNWDVYKKFFDKDERIKNNLQKIADISYKTYEAIKSNNYEVLSSLINEEGELRTELAPGIVPSEISNFIAELRMNTECGFKMCGAGGGGCFILLHPREKKEEIVNIMKSHNMKELPFEILRPLDS